MVLTSRREEGNSTQVVNNVNLLSMSKFLTKVEQEGVVYAFLPYGNNTIDGNTKVLADV